MKQMAMEMINTLLPTKSQIVSATLKRHELAVNRLNNRIKELENSANGSLSECHDKYSISYSAETLAELNLLREQIQFSKREWEELLRIESYYDVQHELVEFGSAVITSNKIFLVSGTVDEFDLNGVRVCGVSVCTPLYLAMKSKRKGDTFEYEGTRYKINDIL